ncbi:ead/Ea22-like family protein [Salmonella enterica]
MSNIDKQALRQAAEKATPGNWRRASSRFNGITVTPFSLCDEEVMLAHAVEKRDAEFIVAANPATMLALLDELESKQTFQHAFFRQSLMYDVVAEAYEEAKEQIAKDVEIKARLCRESNSLHDRLRAAERSIAELESKNSNLRIIAHERNELAIRVNLDSINDAVEMDRLHKRIAELEAREVILPDRKSEIFWPGDAAEFDILGYVIAVKSAIRAAGIKVKES